MIDKELAKKNLETHIAELLRIYTQDTGEIVDDIYISEHEFGSDVYYDIDLELL